MYTSLLAVLLFHYHHLCDLTIVAITIIIHFHNFIIIIIIVFLSLPCIFSSMEVKIPRQKIMMNNRISQKGSLLLSLVEKMYKNNNESIQLKFSSFFFFMSGHLLVYYFNLFSLLKLFVAVILRHVFVSSFLITFNFM